MSRKIAILAHERQHHVKRDYMVDTYAEFWREDGHEVFTLYGIEEQVPADVVIVHVDLSVVPETYLAFARQYPVALNANVQDIRKSGFSRQILHENDNYSSPVIVKSDLNFAGAPERFLRQSTATGPVFRSPMDYRVFPDLTAVPTKVFRRSDLVVEKFLPEIEDGLYHMRAMTFIGSRITCTRFSARHPIVNGTTQVRIEDVEPHPEMVVLKDKLDFQYGKFDYVIHQGKPILLDINKTVGAPPPTQDPEVLAGRRYRAEGIYEFF